jgi:hypothetical protein
MSVEKKKRQFAASSHLQRFDFGFAFDMPKRDGRNPNPDDAC